MALIKILKEQETFGFTGRINILDKSSGQFLGVIMQEEGVIVNARYRDGKGKKALFRLTIDDLKDDKSAQAGLRFVVEPEVIEDADRSFELSVADYEVLARELYERSESSRKLRPSDDLRVALNSSFIVEGENVTWAEFDVMAVISDYPKIEDVYKHSQLYEFEVTSALVSLRKKGALKVLRKGE